IAPDPLPSSRAVAVMLRPRRGVPPCPLEDPVDGSRVDNDIGRNSAPGRAVAAVDLPLELTGCVRVGVYRDHATELDRPAQQAFRRVEPLGARVDLDRNAVARAGGEDRIRVELRLGS